MVFRLPVALLLQVALCLASAATNYFNTSVMVDDQDPLFQYDGTWERSTLNVNGGNLQMDMDGGHMLTYSPGSSATITYTFASVYFLAALWPYPVSTDYAIDGNLPFTIDLQDHSVPVIATGPPQQGGNATVFSRVVGQWTSTANKEHTIHVTIPAGGEYAIVDMFIFEVLNSSSTSSTISSTSQTSSSTGTTSETSPSSSSSSSGSQGPSSTIERDLAISMGVVGSLLAILHHYY